MPIPRSSERREFNGRSRSPRNNDRREHERRRRSRSVQRDHSHRNRRNNGSTAAALPFRQEMLHKSDYGSHKALFADYLDLQKRLDIDALSEVEIKGRWKSFQGKWNRGELAEGWYDPNTKTRAEKRATEPHLRLTQTEYHDHKSGRNVPRDAEEEDDYGPSLPQTSNAANAGPSIPSFQDLQHRRELQQDDRQAQIADLRSERKHDRIVQKERLEDLVPRADPGSRERQLEKKREATVSNRVFAESKESGTLEVPESDLMGDDGEEAYKAKMKANERKKNEREIRKEEIMRARAAEREERLNEHRQKEEKTMAMLRALAQQRFGGSSE